MGRAVRPSSADMAPLNLKPRLYQYMYHMIQSNTAESLPLLPPPGQQERESRSDDGMIEVYPGLFIGSRLDYERLVSGQAG
jgi:hypothetical protein